MEAVRHLEFEFWHHGPYTKSSTTYDYVVKTGCLSHLSRWRYCDFI